MKTCPRCDSAFSEATVFYINRWRLRGVDMRTTVCSTCHNEIQSIQAAAEDAAKPKETWEDKLKIQGQGDEIRSIADENIENLRKIIAAQQSSLERARGEIAGLVRALEIAQQVQLPKKEV